MTTGFSAQQALQIVSDPTTTGAMLQFIAVKHRELWRQIANHPNCYPDLLDWMDAHGGASLKPGETEEELPIPQPPGPVGPQIWKEPMVTIPLARYF